MDLGVVAGEDRWPARHTGKRTGVVATEVDRVVLEPWAPGSAVRRHAATWGDS